MTRRAAAVLTTVIAGALALPASAAAHGLVGKQDLPIPMWLLGWAAAVVLVVSFAALAVLWTEPKLEQLRERVVWARIPVVLDVLCGAIGVAVFAAVVYAGLAGSQSPQENVAPTFVYVVFWVAVPFATLVLGDVFRAFNPWRAVARAVAWVAGRIARGGLPAPLPYPSRLGRWPAAIGIVGFAWLELVSVHRDDPSLLAVLMLAYAAIQLIGMSLYGVDAWLRNGDAFGVWFGLIARMAPLRWRDRSLAVRRPLSGLPSLDPRPGTVALVCVAIGTTAFDGLSQGRIWSDVAPDLQQLFIDAGLSASSALQLAFTVGLAIVVAIVYGIFRLGVAGMTTAGEAHHAGELARSFAHTLVPIAFAYMVAHYFSLLAFQGQAMAYLVSDPLGNGSDLLGTADATIDYRWIGGTAVQYIQVAALVIGHVAALVLAHDRAVALYRDPRAATRSQYWMLVVMVGFTGLGIWLLSEAAQ